MGKVVVVERGGRGVGGEGRGALSSRLIRDSSLRPLDKEPILWNASGLRTVHGVR